MVLALMSDASTRIAYRPLGEAAWKLVFGILAIARPAQLPQIRSQASVPTRGNISDAAEYKPLRNNHSNAFTAASSEHPHSSSPFDLRSRRVPEWITYDPRASCVRSSSAYIGRFSLPALLSCQRLHAVGGRPYLDA